MFVHSFTSHVLPCSPTRLPSRRRRTLLRTSRGSGGSSGSGGGGHRDSSGGNGDGWSPRLSWFSIICGAQILTNSGPSISAEVKEADGEIENIMDWLGPILASIGFSGVMGFASAAAFKFAGRLFAIAIGICFAALQCMVYFEVININWKKVEQKLDITGDGKFNQNDIEVAMRVFLKILTQVTQLPISFHDKIKLQGVPGISGFATGFILGLKLT
eukprot:g4826.t1